MSPFHLPVRSTPVRIRAVLHGLAAAGLLLYTPVPAVAQSGAPVTYNRDVAPILYENCATCHRPGEAAPFSLLTYEDARQRGRLIATAVANHVMPPWQPESEEGEFTGDRRLSRRQIGILQRWVDEGMLQGNESERPTPPAFTDGWQLGAPDVVVTMPESFTVPAEGPDVFHNFVLPIPLGERRFVRAIEFRPGNARVVHHARMLLDDTGDIRRLDEAEPGPGFAGMDVPGARFPDGHFLGWAPGRSPAHEAYPWPLEPGTDLVIQMHFKPSGRPETLQASVGLYLTDTPPAKTPVMIRLGSKTIDIPAGAASYEVTDRFTLPTDVVALSIYPHAHYLAREMLVTARLPKGQTDTLLRIPDWDFNWQDEYAYAQPVPLPRGTVIEMRYVYDNSPQNPQNPSSPPDRVRFGSGTRDEMGELLVQVLPTAPAGVALLRSQIATKNLLTDVAGEEKRIADLPDDAETRNALGVAYAQLGRMPDAVAQIEASLRIDPDLAMAHYNLGVIAMGERRIDEAIGRFQRAIGSSPDYVEAHNNLGIALETAGRREEAAGEYRRALALRPSHPAAHNNLGRLLLEAGAVRDAMVEFRAALRTRPDNPDALYNLGRALLASGEARAAAQQWRRAVAQRPESLVFTLDLAWLLATNPDAQDVPAAIRLAEGVNRTAKNGHAAALDVLAAAYAADGRVDLAARTAQRALQRALADKNDPLAREIRKRLAGYQQQALGEP